MAQNIFCMFPHDFYEQIRESIGVLGYSTASDIPAADICMHQCIFNLKPMDSTTLSAYVVLPLNKLGVSH